MVVRQLIALPSQLQLIARLQHHIYLSSSLLFVSGEQGAGKSTLLEQLPNKLSGDIQEAFISLSESLSDAQIRLQIISQWYDAPLFDSHDNLFTSIALLQEKQRDDAPHLVIFDNAQYLSPQMLGELSQLIAQKASLVENEVNVLLLADEEKTQEMLRFVNQSVQNSTQKCPCLEFKIEALSNEEADRLLKHTFKQAGYQHQIEHQDAVSKQLNSCAGVAQKIVELAQEIATGKLVNNEDSWLKLKLPAVSYMLILLLIAVGLVNYLYPLLLTSLPEKVEFTKSDKNEVVNTQNTPLITEPKEPVMVEALAGHWRDNLTPDIKANPLVVGISDKGVKRMVLSEQNIFALSQPETSDKANVVQPVKINELTKEKITKPIKAVEIQQVAKPAVVKAVEQQNIKQATAAETKKVIFESDIVPLISDPKINSAIEKKVPVAKTQRDPIFTEKSSLLAIPATHYTVQVSAMAAEKTLQEFIAKHGLPKKDVYVYQTVRNNKPWYVVIIGNYKYKSQALKASTKLPGSFANMDFWVKSYQSVHQDLQLNND